MPTQVLARPGRYARHHQLPVALLERLNRFAKKRGVARTEVVVKLLGWAEDATEAEE